MYVGEGQGKGVTAVIPADVCDGEVTVAALITAKKEMYKMCIKFHCWPKLTEKLSKEYR